MKRIISVILSVLFLIIPFTGCKEKKEAKYYTLSNNGEYITLSFDGETVYTKKIDIISGILLIPEKDDIPQLYVEEDGTKMAELFELLSLENMVLSEEKERSGEKIRVVFEKDEYEIKQLSFYVTQRGEIEYCDETTGKYYSTKKGVADYEELLDFCKEKQYDFPYELTSSDDRYFLLDGEQTVFSCERLKLTQMVCRIGSGYVFVTEFVRIQRLIDTLFTGINLRLNEGEYLFGNTYAAYTFYEEDEQLDLFINVTSNGRIYVKFNDKVYVSEINSYDFWVLVSYFTEDYEVDIHG